MLLEERFETLVFIVSSGMMFGLLCLWNYLWLYEEIKVEKYEHFKTWFRDEQGDSVTTLFLTWEAKVIYFFNSCFPQCSLSSKLQLSYRKFFYHTCRWAEYISSLHSTQTPGPFLVIPSRTSISIIKLWYEYPNLKKFFPFVGSNDLHILWKFQPYSI